MNRFQARQSWGKRLLWSSLCVGAFVLSMQAPMGCAPNGFIDKKDYNAACSKNEDCIAVIAEDLCKCSCNYIGINKSDKAKYETASETVRKTCGTFGKTCGACAEPAPRNIQCENKVCVIKL